MLNQPIIIRSRDVHHIFLLGFVLSTRILNAGSYISNLLVAPKSFLEFGGGGALACDSGAT